MIKGSFGILVIVTLNAINHVMLETIQIIKIVNVEKKLVDTLVEECSKYIDKVKIARITQ